MTNMMRLLRTGAFLVLLGLGPSVAWASFFLDFEGLTDQEPVSQFYNGGIGGGGSGPGPNFGVDFTSNAMALISTMAGGTGNFMNEPSPNCILVWQNGSATTMNAAAGFTTGLSFYYTAVDIPGFVRVYDGLNGTGNELAYVPLPALGSDPNLPFHYNRWAPIGVTFAGTARSVDFGDTALHLGLDNVTFGSLNPQSPVPEPSALLLLSIGAAGTGGAILARRRRPGKPTATDRG